jgi:hypothetical protein
MKSKQELQALAVRYGWEPQKSFTPAQMRAMSSNEYAYHLAFSADALANVENAEATKGIVEKAEALSRWRQIAEAFQRNRGFDSETLEMFAKVATEFERRHPEISPELENGKILASYMVENHLDPTKIESYETAYRQLGGKSAFRLSAAAQQQEDEKRMGADEYKKLHPELSKERYFDPLQNKIVTRGIPERVLARWDIALKTFRATEKRYLPNEGNKEAMIGYLVEHGMDLSLTNLQTAFSELSKAGKLELQSSPEQAAQKGRSQTTVLHDLGGSAPGYPLYYNEHGKQSFRRLVAEMSSSELRRRCQTDSQFRKAIDGLNED